MSPSQSRKDQRYYSLQIASILVSHSRGPVEDLIITMNFDALDTQFPPSCVLTIVPSGPPTPTILTPRPSRHYPYHLSSSVSFLHIIIKLIE